MTVCLGFNCGGGIVMCADSKETYPDAVKVDVSKIRSIQSEYGSFVLTGATNDGDLMDSTIGRIVEKLASQSFEIHRPKGWKASQPLMEDAIREVMAEVREESIIPFPVDQQPWINLLIGVSRRGVDGLFKATPRAVVEVSQHTVVGAGLVQAKTLLDRLWKPQLSRLEMEVFAVYVMWLIKKYVPDVDGYTDLVSLVTPFGHVKWWRQADVMRLEQVFAKFDEYYGKELLSYVCCGPDDPHVKFKTPDIKKMQEMLTLFRDDIWNIASPVEAAFQKDITR